MNSLTIIVFTAMLIEGFAVNPPRGMMAALEECCKKYDLNVESILNKEPVPEEKKCFHHCMAIKTGIMNEKNEIPADEVREKLKSHNAPVEVLERFEKCSTIKKDDPCDMASEVCGKTLPMGPEMMKYTEACKKELNITDEMLKPIRPSGKATCYPYCMGNKISLMNRKGEVTIEAFKAAWMEPAFVDYIKALEVCMKKVPKVANDDEVCEYALDLRECIRAE